MTLKIICTCSACPEQYDVHDQDGQTVGYLRLRHGFFRAEAYVDGDEHIVYTATTEGDGSFEPEERQGHLDRALDAIERALSPTPVAPGCLNIPATEMLDLINAAIPHMDPDDHNTALEIKIKIETESHQAISVPTPLLGKYIALAASNTQTPR